jgi:hypothetical protein
VELALRQDLVIQEDSGADAREALCRKYSLARWDGTGLFIGPDGEEIDASRLLDDPERAFTVNERVVYFADQYSKMVREEQDRRVASGGRS